MISDAERARFERVDEHLQRMADGRDYLLSLVWSDDFDPESVYWRLRPESLEWDARLTIRLEDPDAGYAWLQRLDEHGIPVTERDEIEFRMGGAGGEDPIRVDGGRHEDPEEAARAILDLLEP